MIAVLIAAAALSTNLTAWTTLVTDQLSRMVDIIQGHSLSICGLIVWNLVLTFFLTWHNHKPKESDEQAR